MPFPLLRTRKLLWFLAALRLLAVRHDDRLVEAILAVSTSGTMLTTMTILLCEYRCHLCPSQVGIHMS